MSTSGVGSVVTAAETMLPPDPDTALVQIVLDPEVQLLLSNGLWQTEKCSTAAEDEAGSSAEDLTLLSCFTRHSSTLLAASVVVGGLAALPIGYLGYWLRATVTFGQEGLCRREGSVAKLDDGLVKDGEGIVEIGSVPEDDEGEQSVVPFKERSDVSETNEMAELAVPGSASEGVAGKVEAESEPRQAGEELWPASRGPPFMLHLLLPAFFMLQALQTK